MNENLKAGLALINVWLGKGQFEKALKSLEKLALEYPKNSEVWRDLGTVKQQLKLHEEAKKHLIYSLEINDRDVDAHCSLGGVYLSLGEIDLALKAFEKGLKISGNLSTFALLNYLVIIASQGTLKENLPRFHEALEIGEVGCKEDIRLGNNLPWSCFDLAQISLLSGDMEACRDATTQAVRLSNAVWQLNSAKSTYQLLANSPDKETCKRAEEIEDLIESLKVKYFSEPDKKRCFVIMPFGKKLNDVGIEVDFDEVYHNFIKPTVEAEGLDCIRCDEVDESGNIHKRMFQLIWQADVAIADVSILNPNVFYELGIRHALRRAVTIIIRNKNATLPFNIANMNTVEYDIRNGKVDENARASIQGAIAAGLKGGVTDSHVSDILNLKISDTARAINSCDTYSYSINGTNKKLSLITGDLRNVRGIDVWVNSENTNMQMARYFDFSISSVIRFEAAKKSRTGHVTEDVIQSELDEIMAGERSVPDAQVIASGPGELSNKNDVKAVFHAAAVRGAVGEGYEPVPGIHRCVSNALALMDDQKNNGANTKLTSILFSLLGIGFVHGDFRPTLELHINAALEYLVCNPSSNVESVCFLVWSEQELALCQSVLRSFEIVGTPIHILSGD